MAGQRTSVTDPRGEVRSFGFTDAGLVGSATDPLGRTSTMTYDAVGRMVASVDARGEAIGTAARQGDI